MSGLAEGGYSIIKFESLSAFSFEILRPIKRLQFETHSGHVGQSAIKIKREKLQIMGQFLNG